MFWHSYQLALAWVALAREKRSVLNSRRRVASWLARRSSLLHVHHTCVGFINIKHVNIQSRTRVSVSVATCTVRKPPFLFATGEISVSWRHWSKEVSRYLEKLFSTTTKFLIYYSLALLSLICIIIVIIHFIFFDFSLNIFIYFTFNAVDMLSVLMVSVQYYVYLHLSIYIYISVVILN